jgi:hypothetical protein
LWEYAFKRILEVSSLSLYDIALINATWTNFTDEYFQCKKYESQVMRRSDAKELINRARLAKSCGVLKDEVKVEIGHIGYHSCLCHENFQHPSFGYIMNLYQNFEKGFLPFTGGIMDQPAAVMELIDLISSLYAERDLAQQQKELKKSSKTKGK